MSLPSVIACGNWSAAKFPLHTLQPFLRDRFACHYCGDPQELTFDRSFRAPRGADDWENVSTACAPCNLQGGTHAGAGAYAFAALALPADERSCRSMAELPAKLSHESWRDYLYWDAELEP